MGSVLLAMVRPPFSLNSRLPGELRMRVAPALVGLSALAGIGALMGAGTPAVRAQEQGSQSAPRTMGAMERIDAIVADAQGLQRALNLARDAAIRLNGGLSVYRPANCMYAGISDNPCLISREDRGFVFRFQGGAPGWEQLQLPATTETEILVSKDGRSVLEVIYNGPPRS